jgi:DNA-binding transcriptional ArsR family regulator
MQETKQVGGVEEMKAVAHPLRVRLLGSLREHGPATATELAKRFQTDTGSTSYHLRKLAQFGFVEEVADPSGHHRARRWQAAHKTTSWSNTQLAATAEGREVVGFIHRRQVQTLTENLERFHSAMAELPEPWVEAFGNGDMIATLTHESLNALWDNFYADLARLSEEDSGNPEALPVAIFVSGLPR